jgi:hypothetical protein
MALTQAILPACDAMTEMHVWIVIRAGRCAVAKPLGI